MSFDLLGQILGKARRQSLNIDWKPISQRLGFGLAAAAAVAAAQPSMLTTSSGRIGLAATFLAGAVPAGSAPAGILSAVHPGAGTLAGAAQAALTALADPATRRQEAAQLAQTALVQQSEPSDPADHQGSQEAAQ